MLIGMEGPGDSLICRQMLRGWDDHGETWMGGGLEVKAILVVKDNPNPPPTPHHISSGRG